MATKAVVPQVDDADDELDFGPNAEFIAPKVDLRSKARDRRAKPGDIDPVAAAEAAMADMSQKFSGWMVAESVRLIAACQACADADYADAERKELFARAHDIKGQAATLGFPAAGKVAASLCRLFELVAPSRIPRELVQQHVLAIRAISQESLQNQANAIANKLADRLTTVTNDYIASLG